MQLSATITKPAYDLPALLKLVPVGRSLVYEEIAAGHLRATKVGRRTIFLADDVATWLEHLRATSAAAGETQATP